MEFFYTRIEVTRDNKMVSSFVIQKHSVPWVNPSSECDWNHCRRCHLRQSAIYRFKWRCLSGPSFCTTWDSRGCGCTPTTSRRRRIRWWMFCSQATLPLWRRCSRVYPLPSGMPGDRTHRNKSTEVNKPRVNFLVRKELQQPILLAKTQCNC